MRKFNLNIHSRVLLLILCVGVLVSSVFAPTYSNAVTKDATGYDIGDVVDGDVLLRKIADVGHWEPCETTVRDPSTGSETIYPINLDIYQQYGVTAYGTMEDILELNPNSTDFMPTDINLHGYKGYFKKGSSYGEYKYLGYTPKGEKITNDKYFRDADRFGSVFSEDYKKFYSTDGRTYDVTHWKRKPGVTGDNNKGWYNFDSTCTEGNKFILTSKVRALLTTNFEDTDHPSAKRPLDNDTGFCLATLILGKPLSAITDEELLSIMPYCKVFNTDGGMFSKVSVKLDYLTLTI